MNDETTSRPPSPPADELPDAHVLMMRMMANSLTNQEKLALLMQGLSYEHRYRIICGDGLQNVTVRSDANALESHHVELGQQTGGTSTIDNPQSTAVDARPITESRASEGAYSIPSERSTAIP